MARQSLAALSGQASEADRLELEAHLEECAKCRGEHAALGVVRTLRSWQPDGLSEVARERTRQRALRAARETPHRAVEKPFSRRLKLGAALSFVVTTALVALLLLRPPPNRVVAGDVEVLGSPGVKIPDGARLRVNHGGRAVFGRVTVDFREDTDAVWHEAARAVELERGAVTVEVTPGKGQRFQVTTSRFNVEVVGTRFSVDLHGVHTEHGTVRVTRPDGSLVTLVTAGQHWALEESRSQAQLLPRPALSDPPRPAALSTSAPGEARELPAPSAVPAKRREASDVDRLAQARQALTRGDADTARALLSPLYRLSRQSAVEARALLAESYLIEGRYGDAIDSYRTVVRDFQGTAQAESALYAIAQLQVESAQHEAAAHTLRKYLSRYPEGRFAKEARERLDRLTSPIDP